MERIYDLENEQDLVDWNKDVNDDIELSNSYKETGDKNV